MVGGATVVFEDVFEHGVVLLGCPVVWVVCDEPVTFCFLGFFEGFVEFGPAFVPCFFVWWWFDAFDRYAVFVACGVGCVLSCPIYGVFECFFIGCAFG